MSSAGIREFADETHSSGPVLAYHEFGTGRSRDVYQISAARFVQHVANIRDAAMHHRQPLVSFDDAHVSQLTIAAPVLETSGLFGLFFVPAGWVGTRRHTATWTELRGLLRHGHSVGSHGLTHKFLTNCSHSELIKELSESKTALEQHLGISVESLSLPGGRMNDEVLEKCLATGYTTVYTSDPIQRLRRFKGREGRDLTLVGRFAMRRSTHIRTIRNYVSEDRFTTLALGLGYQLRCAARRSVGDVVYQGLWSRCLRRPIEADIRAPTAHPEQIA